MIVWIYEFPFAARGASLIRVLILTSVPKPLVSETRKNHREVTRV